MKKRILFVDDETLVLQGLQRMLRTMREEWDMEFLDSGSRALERMAEIPFDVVVSDMRMPGMNGAEFLSRVMQRYPKTVRLILSGHADKDLILQCVGSTHQFLSKPCDPEAIKATVRRASAGNGSLRNETVKKLVSQMDRLPSIPSLYVEIVDALRDPETDLESVGAIISKDIAMTAQILKLVNSAFFGLRRQVSSPAEAANYLGLDTIRSLVLSINAFSQYEAVKIPGFSIAALWSHSLETAAAAKAIALAEDADRRLADEAFVAGLLHDTGKLVLAANFTDQFSQVITLMQRESLSQVQAEEQVFGASHADIGGHLLGLWGLPVPVVEAIDLHHRPGDSPPAGLTPLILVHAADALVHESHGNAAVGNQLDMACLTAAGLSDHLPAWRTSLQTPTSTQEQS
ncbi:MAG: HDOD domain-containing protein [Opitutaceae bacterium]|nr:HDOD domain-containing protein [Verrucomicrobiales bacterium]